MAGKKLNRKALDMALRAALAEDTPSKWDKDFLAVTGKMKLAIVPEVCLKIGFRAALFYIRGEKEE